MFMLTRYPTLVGVALLFPICVSTYSDVSSESIKELPFCGPEKSLTQRRLVFVSTLDGKLSALNIDNGGLEQWSINTGPGPMLSSSIHTLELTNNGQWVRMIPSLSGGLYKFDGENVEPIPVNAEKLLQSSFRYSEDTIISGGKESRTYGVDSVTGNVLYECSMDRCLNLTESGPTAGGDVVVIQRQTQTVRAVEPRSGVERWNFSVGTHGVRLAADPDADCHSPPAASSDILLRAIVPDGLLCAVSKSRPSLILWSRKFDFPIVSAWQLDRGDIKWVDLFGGDAPSMDVPKAPLLYIGMHKKQLYIQESVVMQRKMIEYSVPQLPARPNTIIPWKPVPARALEIPGNSDGIQLITDEGTTTTALSILYGSEYVNGNGFFLFEDDDNKGKVCPPTVGDNKSNISISTIHHSDSEDYPGVWDQDDHVGEKHIHIEFLQLSIWHWWKEIVVLVVSTAILAHVISPFAKWLRNIGRDKLCAAEKESLESKGSSSICKSPIPVPVPSPNPESHAHFRSRYVDDFEPLQCLGKGGFGTVFQARNKIDDCHYAIKRIQLPNKDENRERVMREVKALAKLDHPNIVRFFNAWLECPPLHWQEKQDALWVDKFQSDSVLSGGATTVDLTGAVTPVSETSPPIKSKGIGSKFSSTLSTTISSLARSVRSMINQEQSRESSASFIVFQDPDAGISRQSSLTQNTGTRQRRPTSLSIGSPKRNNAMSDDHSAWAEGGDAIASPRMFLYIQMQLCQKESLREWLRTVNPDRAESINIFHQIVQAVEYIHLQGLIHRDLKPSNIFFSPEGKIKVGDFGLVTAMAEGYDDKFDSPLARRNPAHTSMVGTHLYMSPEQLIGKGYNYKVDIYSLGLILFELLVSFGTDMERITLLKKIKSLEFPEEFVAQYKEEHALLKLMLSEVPDERPTTIGIRHRAPLKQLQTDLDLICPDWHFDLPHRRSRNPSLGPSPGPDSS